jgi:hypothetical protein
MRFIEDHDAKRFLRQRPSLAIIVAIVDIGKTMALMRNSPLDSPAGFAMAISINNMQYADYYS